MIQIVKTQTERSLLEKLIEGQSFGPSGPEKREVGQGQVTP